MSELDRINEAYGTSFSLGDRVEADRGEHKSPHRGILAGTEEGNLKIFRYGDKAVYPAMYYPSRVRVLN